MGLFVCVPVCERDNKLRTDLDEEIQATGYVWLGRIVVRAWDVQSTSREFDSWPPRCQMQPHCASLVEQYNLVPA